MNTKKETTARSGQPQAPSHEQLWSCLQRYLVFDSPDNRWDKLVNLLLKQFKSDKLKPKDFLEAPLSEQEKIFCQRFGPNNEQSLKQSRIFNLFLALRDFRTYEPAAFDTWYLSLPPEYSSEIVNEDDAGFLNQIVQRMELTSSQQAWLEHSWRACPNWSCLSMNGPWDKDPLAVFAGRALRVCSEMPDSLTADDFMKCCTTLDQLLTKSRAKLPASFQPEMVILVEGPTEAILLPHFAQLDRFDFTASGILVIPCGGTNQLERRYLILRDICRIPVLLVLDNDAEEKINTIKDILRPHDRLFVWRTGEIEDTFEINFLVKLLNSYLQTLASGGLISGQDFLPEERRTFALDRIWKNRALGKFDKVGFAEFIKASCQTATEIPDEIRSLTQAIKELKSKTT
ncbi:MAG: ATP-dependent endonuclease [Candidatus Obscuribacterales bacterium]|nr:ATP-dependent endonuclease [Candidatus Obscuribacterales bacterium]